ncbi:hypothetical protein VP01_2061g2 [Puccinia sorghi]|uniref:Uncharacterized protein n=1 Tax=Puccinia sorghi TaxID=27349 RepID=A0A0L6VBB7_9BASI|nr:hypothetical protein VP01_2061g2 [Puccinia sorghi]
MFFPVFPSSLTHSHTHTLNTLLLAFIAYQTFILTVPADINSEGLDLCYGFLNFYLFISYNIDEIINSVEIKTVKLRTERKIGSSTLSMLFNPLTNTLFNQTLMLIQPTQGFCIFFLEFFEIQHSTPPPHSFTPCPPLISAPSQINLIQQPYSSIPHYPIHDYPKTPWLGPACPHSNLRSKPHMTNPPPMIYIPEDTFLCLLNHLCSICVMPSVSQSHTPTAEPLYMRNKTFLFISENLLNCLQSTYSMLQPICDSNYTCLNMYMFWHSHCAFCTVKLHQSLIPGAFCMSNAGSSESFFLLQCSNHSKFTDLMSQYMICCPNEFYKFHSINCGIMRILLDFIAMHRLLEFMKIFKPLGFLGYDLILSLNIYIHHHTHKNILVELIINSSNEKKKKTSRTVSQGIIQHQEIIILTHLQNTINNPPNNKLAEYVGSIILGAGIKSLFGRGTHLSKIWPVGLMLLDFKKKILSNTVLVYKTDKKNIHKYWFKFCPLKIYYFSIREIFNSPRVLPQSVWIISTPYFQVEFSVIYIGPPKREIDKRIDGKYGSDLVMINNDKRKRKRKKKRKKIIIGCRLNSSSNEKSGKYFKSRNRFRDCCFYFFPQSLRFQIDFLKKEEFISILISFIPSFCPN